MVLSSKKRRSDTIFCIIGLGALMSSLVAAQFAKSSKHWSYHNLLSMGLYMINFLFMWYVSRGRPQQEIMEEEGETGVAKNAVDSNKYKQVKGSPYPVHVLFDLHWARSHHGQPERDLHSRDAPRERELRLHCLWVLRRSHGRSHSAHVAL
ncbi:hypothetical protein BD413DRAFT_575907 [Trametes elegans]|nr:hypothetical protein BD413DRAFT_575907 [Trametes elegans]